MSTTHDTHSAKDGRDASIREEQAFCLRALESGAYDSMSDQAWVTLCEELALKARHIAAEDAGKASPEKHGGHCGEKHVP